MIISRSVHVTGQKASFHSFLCLSNILVCVCVCLCTTSSKNRVIAIPFLGTVCCFVAKSCITLRPHGLYLTRLFCPWDFPGKNTGVGCHFLPQWLFPTQVLPYPRIKPTSPALVCGFFTMSRHRSPDLFFCCCCFLNFILFLNFT